jgi:hypothetical protein
VSKLDPFVTPQEASTIVGCALSTIYLAISRGELTPIHASSKLLRRADVEKYRKRPVGTPIRKEKNP